MPIEKIDDFLKIYKVFRDYSEHEDDLINHRSGWLVTVQSVLLATFGFSLQKYFEIKERIGENRSPKELIEKIGDFSHRFMLFTIILAVIGFVISIGAFFSINAARVAHQSIRERWDSEFANEPYAKRLPYIQGGGSKFARKSGSWLALFLPGFFGSLWLLTLMVMLGISLTMQPL